MDNTGEHGWDVHTEARFGVCANTGRHSKHHRCLFNKAAFSYLPFTLCRAIGGTGADVTTTIGVHTKTNQDNLFLS